MARTWRIGKVVYGYGFIDTEDFLETPFVGVAINTIKGPDKLHPHDHPQSFISFILSGGYTERVWRDPSSPDEFIDVKRSRFSIHKMKHTAAHNILEIKGPSAKTFFIKLREVRDSPRFWVDGAPVEVYEYMRRFGVGPPKGRS